MLAPGRAHAAPGAARPRSPTRCAREAVSGLVAGSGRFVCALLPGFLDDELFELRRARRRRARGEALGPRPAAGAGRAVAAGARARGLPRGALRARGARARRAGRERRRAATATPARRRPRATVATYRDLGSFQLLLSLQDSDALRLFCESLLGPIEHGEGHYGGELMRSLEAFIECNGQWEAAARRLYCHRHTLRYRIRKVEELTGRDLGSRPRPHRVLARPARARDRPLRRTTHRLTRSPVKVGVPTEIKTDEYRVALTPSGVRELIDARPRGAASRRARARARRSPTSDYVAQGATIVPDADAVFAEAELIVKVKEPQPDEVARLEPRHTLFTYLHLAPDPELTRGLIESGATCIAYETVEDARGRLPLLAPMSEVAGKIATQAGAFMLEKPLGGRGLLLGGVPGVAAGKVMVIGGGVVGHERGGDRDRHGRGDLRLRPQHRPPARARGRCSTAAARPCFASTLEIEQRLPEMDLVIGAVLVHGAKAPRVITRAQLALMKRNAVLVDVSIDQGGCFETSHADDALRPDLRGRRRSRTTAWPTCPARCRSRRPTR